MRVLVACECSGVVRDAFAARGHDAWSCDLVPARRHGHVQHIMGDVLNVLNGGWDLMIAHPPCTYLANSGCRWLFEKPGRWEQLDAAAAFFLALLNAPIPRVAVENPKPHKWAAERIGRKYDQIIHPWQFGHRQKKSTCLWLRGLPPITPTNIVGPPPKDKQEAKAWERIWRMPRGPMQARRRSVTFKGIADAMADQWGNCENPPKSAARGLDW